MQFKATSKVGGHTRPPKDHPLSASIYTCRAFPKPPSCLIVHGKSSLKAFAFSVMVYCRERIQIKSAGGRDTEGRVLHCEHKVPCSSPGVRTRCPPGTEVWQYARSTANQGASPPCPEFSLALLTSLVASDELGLQVDWCVTQSPHPRSHGVVFLQWPAPP